MSGLQTATAGSVALHRDQVQGNWTQMTGKAGQQWGDPTDDDLAQADGDRKLLEGKPPDRYGDPKEDVETKLGTRIDSL